MKNETNFPSNLLSERNLKATSTRVELLELIHSYGKAMPYSKIQSSLKKADRITLYRNLNKLLEKGILHKAHTTDEETYYALCDTHCTEESHSHNHIHFRCTSCKSVTCEELENEIVLKLPQFQIEHANINLVGICKNCA